MKASRRMAVFITAILAALVAGGVATWRLTSSSNPAVAGLSIMPDLSRWPAAFRVEMEAAMREVRQGADPEQALSRLAALYFANDLATEAENALRTLRTLQPENPRWPYLLAVLLSRRNAPDEAEPLLRETLALEPEYSPARFQLGQILAATGRDEEARRFYEQRLASEPEDVLATMGLVDIERRSGEPDSAIRRLEELLRVKPEAAEARLLLTEILDSVGRTEEAARHRLIVQRIGVATPPQDPWVDELHQFSFDPFRLQTLGQLRLNTQKVNDALFYLRRAAELAPDDPEIQDLFAQALHAAGQTDQARAALEHAIGRVADPTLLYVRLGELLVGQDRAGEAEALLRKAIASRPDRAELHDALGRTLYQSLRYEEAILAFQDALRLSPMSADTHLDLGRALGAAGRRAEARRMIIQAVEMRPAGHDGLLLLGRLELEEGRLAEAEALGARLLEAGDNSVPAQALFEQAVQQRANRAAAAGRLDDAEVIFQRSLEVAPHIGALHGDYGAFLAKQQRFEEALGYFERYVELAPEDPRAWLFLGTALRATGKIDDAKAAFVRGRDVARRVGDTTRVALFEQALAP